MLSATDLDNAFLFGGSGADGALTVTSGTTQISLGNALSVEKNYSSISITGTGKVQFINPNNNGTFIIIRCRGNCVLTSSSTPMFDASSCGAANGYGGLTTDAVAVNGGSNGSTQFNTGISAGGGAVGGNYNISVLPIKIAVRGFLMATGGGGGTGIQAAGSSTSAGGSGGGALYLEIAGSLNFTTANGISIAGATASNAPSGYSGGGGGAGGTFICIYNSLIANSGTVNVAGGSGGNSGSGRLGGSGGNGTSGSGNGGNGGGDSGFGGPIWYASGGGGGGNYLATSDGSAGQDGNNPNTRGAGGGGASGYSLFLANNYF